MSTQVFLKLDGLPGESTDADHKDEIEVLSFSWGVSSTASMHQSGGGGAGKPVFQDLSIVKYLDAASSGLLSAAAQGSVINRGILTVSQAGGRRSVISRFTMQQIVVTNLDRFASSGGDRVSENVTLNFAKFEDQYLRHDERGNQNGEFEWGFDIPSGRPI